MKKRLFIALMACVFAFGLVACSNSKPAKFEMGASDETGAPIVTAENATTDMEATGSITVTEGDVLLISPDLTAGSVHVGLSEGAKLVFEKTVSGRVLDAYDVPAGEYSLMMSPAEDGTTGTVLVYALPREEFEAQNEGLAEALEEEGADPESIGMANPWSDVDSAEAAAELAVTGEFNVPENGAEVGDMVVHIDGFRAMDGLAEANGLIGSAELTLRKGIRDKNDPSFEVSGDYNTYKNEWTIGLDGFELHCFGNADGQAKKVTWNTDNFSYSINVQGQGDESETFGLNDDTVIALAQSMI